MPVLLFSMPTIYRSFPLVLMGGNMYLHGRDGVDGMFISKSSKVLLSCAELTLASSRDAVALTMNPFVESQTFVSWMSRSYEEPLDFMQMSSKLERFSV
jgi:hypothetical protein